MVNTAYIDNLRWCKDCVDVDGASIITQRWQVQSLKAKIVELVQESDDLVG